MASAFEILILPTWYLGGAAVRYVLGWDREFDAVLRRGGFRFSEDYASGIWRGRPLYGLMGGASWGLSVRIIGATLWVWPMRPWRPTLLGRVLGLEWKLPLRRVQLAEDADASFGRRKFRLTVTREGEGPARLSLWLRKSDEFRLALERGIVD